MAKGKVRVFFPMRKHMKYYGKHLFVIAVREIMEGWGFDARIVPSERYKEWPIRKGDIVFYADAGSTRTSPPWAKSRGAWTYYFNMEPADPLPHYPEPNRHRVASYARVLRANFDVVFDYNGNTTENLRSLGVNAYLLPIGYHESFERPRLKPYRAGVHFLGNEMEPEFKNTKPGKERNLKSRRGKMCDEIRKLGTPCHSHSFRVRTQEEFDRFLWTPGVHLNLHRFPPPFQFGGLRVIAMLMSNQRFVLTEICNWLPPGLVPGVHWDVAPPDEFAERAAYWYSKPRACKKMGRAGYEFLKKSHRLDVELERAMTEAGIL